MKKPSAPQVRVIVRLEGLFKEGLISEGEIVRSYEHVISVSTSLSMRNAGTASVQFSNYGDRFFRVKRKRSKVINLDDGDYVTTWEGSEIDHLKALMDLDLVKYWSVKERTAIASTEEQLKADRKERCEDYYWGTPFSKMDPIFIDMRGRDGRWYGVFVGVITSLGENTSKSSSSTLTLDCKDLTRFFATSSVLLQEPLMRDSENFRSWYLPLTEEMKKFWDSLMKSTDVSSVLKNLFAKVSPSKIFEYIIKVTEANFSSSTFERLLWSRTGLGDLPPSEHRCLRSNALDSSEYSLPRRFVVGPYFAESSSKDFSPLQIQIRDWGIFNIESDIAENILRSMCKVVFSDYYTDGIGNLYWEYPRIGHIPARSLVKEDVVQSDGHSLHPQYGHGPDYNVGDSSLLGWSISEDEEVLFTKVEGQPELHYNVITGDVAKLLSYDSVFLSKEDLATYGYRLFRVPSLYVNTLPPNRRDLFKQYLKAALIFLNSKSRKMSLDFNHRPDFLLNRTVFLIERELVGLIVGVQNTYRMGQGISTKLTCEYVRRVGEQTIHPWKILQTRDSAMQDQVSLQPGDLMNAPYFVGGIGKETV